MNPRYILAVIIAVLAFSGIGYFAFFYEDTPPHCGNGICEPEYGETWETCPGDCDKPEEEHCGNGICEPELGENCMTCPEDCGDCPPESEGLGFRLPYSPIHAGDVFWVTVYCDHPSESIGGWKFTITYDDAVLEAMSVSVDDSIWLYDEGSIKSGSLSDVQAWTTRSDLNEKMDLFRIKFKAVSSGISDLSFTEYKISNSEAERFHPDLNDNSITIE
jgi:hypothetical protein